MRPLLHATAALAAGTLTLAAQAARAEPLTVAARQAADRPYELAVRVGGYGFRREGDPRPGEGWTECRMNGIGVFGTRALSGPLFVEAGLDFYATADIPLPAAEGGFAAPRATSIGSTGAPGRRNAPGFVNIGYRASLTWADHTVTSLAHQARVPMFDTSPVELGLVGAGELEARLDAEPAYEALFAVAFPDDVAPITVANVTRARASFQRASVGGASRFDRFIAGDAAALTAAEQRGFARFSSPDLGCATCHAGADLTTAGAQFFNIGLDDLDGAGAAPVADLGLAEITGAPAHVGRFRVPSLRNVAVTAPYMHDGSVATLAEVLDIYARGGRRIDEGPLSGDGATSPIRSPLVHAFAMTADDRADLLAFLGALTDDALLTDPALADPWN